MIEYTLWTYMKILMTTIHPILFKISGCRKMADNFNRRFAKSKQVTVDKIYVNGIIQQHQYEIQALCKYIKHRKPRTVRRISYGEST